MLGMDPEMSDDSAEVHGEEDESIEDLLSGPKDSVMMFSSSAPRGGRAAARLGGFASGDSLDELTKEIQLQKPTDSSCSHASASSTCKTARRKLHKDLDNFLDEVTRHSPSEASSLSCERNDDESKRVIAQDQLAELNALREKVMWLEREKQEAVSMNQEIRADLESAHLEIWEMKQRVDTLDHEWREAMDAKAMSCAGLDEARQTLMEQQANFDALTKELSQLRGDRDALRVMSAVELMSLTNILAESMSSVQREHHRKLEELKDEQLCVVCMSERKNVVLQPCSHLTMCINCFSKCNTFCPQCRSRVEGHLRIYN